MATAVLELAADQVHRKDLVVVHPGLRVQEANDLKVSAKITQAAHGLLDKLSVGQAAEDAIDDDQSIGRVAFLFRLLGAHV